MNTAQAVVVGLCAHGLAIVRALAESGVEVVALEADSSLPGVATRRASVIMVEDINGPALIVALSAIAPDESAARRPVLIVTNDKMVETVATHYECLAGKYRLSWAQNRHAILKLLKKSAIEERAKQAGLLYPKTKIVREKADLKSAIQTLRFPVIVKPDTPISSYKTLIANTPEQLAGHWQVVCTALPAILQEYIEGDEDQTLFGALYLNDGHVLARLEGKKLKSRPLGHTTIAISQGHDVVHGLARAFFEGLGLSGPVSLELKEDASGNFWAIEPTVGRTDFWVGLCIADGVNLPLIEYGTQTQSQIKSASPRQRTIWINEERDPTGIFWLMLTRPAIILRNSVVWVFVDKRDLAPFFKWCHRGIRRLPGKVFRRLARLRKVTQKGIT